PPHRPPARLPRRAAAPDRAIPRGSVDRGRRCDEVGSAVRTVARDEELPPLRPTFRLPLGSRIATTWTKNQFLAGWGRPPGADFLELLSGAAGQRTVLARSPPVGALHARRAAAVAGDLDLRRIAPLPQVELVVVR